MAQGLRYLILGTGVGKAIYAWLAQQADTAEIVIADKDQLRLRRTKAHLETITGKKCATWRCDVLTLQSEDISPYHVVISALPAQHSPHLAHLCLNARVHLSELGGVVPVTKELRALDQEAKSVGICISPDNGIAPGLIIMLSAHLARSFEEVISIKNYVGGIPQKPKPPVNYQWIFSPKGLMHLCYDMCPILDNGMMLKLPPLTGRETFTVPELAPFGNGLQGKVEAFYTACAGDAPLVFQKQGVSSYALRTVRWPGFVDTFLQVKKESFMRTVRELDLPQTNIQNPDLLWLKIEVEGIRNGKTVTEVLTVMDLFDEKTGLSAMERTTGFSAAYVARLIAQGKAHPGVSTPEETFRFYKTPSLLDFASKTFYYYRRETLQ